MNYSWIQSSNTQPIPYNAVHAGNDKDGSLIYIGRAYHIDDLLPAKIIPARQTAYVSNGKKEHTKTQYEVLVGDGFTWVDAKKGNVPDGAVVGGRTSKGEDLYVGRVAYKGTLTPGKVQRSHGCLYIPFGNKEVSFKSYQVLVYNNRPQWVPSTSATMPFNAILGGQDSDGAPIFVGRAYHMGDQIPAKVLPSKNVAYVSHNGLEVPKTEFEVLCGGNVSWVATSHGHVPANAVPGGHTSTGEPLYVGRGHWMGSLSVGKVHPSHQALYIAYGGAEVPIKQSYEVLIAN